MLFYNKNIVFNVLKSLAHNNFRCVNMRKIVTCLTLFPLCVWFFYLKATYLQRIFTFKLITYDCNSGSS